MKVDQGASGGRSNVPSAEARRKRRPHRRRPSWLFAGPDELILLGAIGLEGLNLRVDLGRKELVPAGPLPAAAMSAPNDYGMARCSRRFQSSFEPLPRRSAATSVR
jgi:hypothetical protein